MELLLIFDEHNVVRAQSGAAELLGIPATTNVIDHALDDLVPHEMDWLNALWNDPTTAASGITTQVTTVGALPRILDVTAFWLPLPKHGDWRVVALRDSSELHDAERRLEQTETLFRNWAEQAPAVIYSSSIDSPGRSLYISPHIETLLGYTTTEWLSQPTLWYERLHPDDREQVLAGSAETRASLQPLSTEYRLLARDGHSVWVSDDAIIARDAAGEPQVWQGMLFDITARKLAEQWLVGQKRVLEQIAQDAPLTSILDLIRSVLEPQIGGVHCAIFLTGPTPSTLRLAAAPCLPEVFVRTMDGIPIAPDARTTGAAAYLREPVITPDIALDERWVPDRDAAEAAGIQACWAIPILSSTNLAVGALTIYADSAREPNDAEKLLIGATVQLARIAIERQQMVEHLVHQAFSDSLTALPNRALLHDRLMQALVRARRRPGLVAVIFLDLDQFKSVNDRFGHHAGDELLMHVADRLRSCVRTEDTVARYGGDEFIILLEAEPNVDEVITVARRVLSRFLAPFEFEQESIGIMPSIGIAIDVTGYADPHDLLRDADRAMYEAKRRGTGGFVLADENHANSS